MAELKGRYQVMDDVAADKLDASVRASLAVDRCAAAMGADYVVMNDLDNVMHPRAGPAPRLPALPRRPRHRRHARGRRRRRHGGLYPAPALRRPAQVVEPGYINPDTGLVDVGHGGPNDYTDPEAKVVIARTPAC